MRNRKPAGKVQADRRMHLRLGHAVDRHLDRVFDRHQAPRAAAVPGDFAQAGVDRGGLSAAGRPGNEDRPRRLRHKGSQRRQHVGGQAEVVEMLVALAPPNSRTTARSPCSVG